MKKHYSIILFFILGVLVITSTVFAYSYVASEIGYTPTDDNWDVDNTKDALDSLYENINSYICMFVPDTQYSGTKGEVGSLYSCNMGDDIARLFYIMKINTSDVQMLMASNITDTVGQVNLSWYDAMSFFETGAGVSVKALWDKAISVGLPTATEISEAGGMTGWSGSSWSYFGVNSTSDSSKKNNYAWLYNNLRGSTYGSNDSAHSPGYWTTTQVASNTNKAWEVYSGGWLGSDALDRSDNNGVRPVVKIPKTIIDLN